VGDEAPQLRRSFLGYGRGNVRRVLTDREAMFARAAEDLRAAEERARAAEEKARGAEDAARAAEEKARGAEQRARSAEDEARAAERDAHQAKQDLVRLEAELATARRRLEERAEPSISTRAAVGSETGLSVAIGTPPAPSGLSSVLTATEEAVSRLIDDARRRGEEQMQEAERRRGEVETEIQRLSEWWNRIEPLVSDVRTSIDAAKDQVNSVSDRIGSVLEPVTKAFGSLGTRLGALAEKAAIPIGGTAPPERAEPTAQTEPEEDVEVVQVGEPDEAPDAEASGSETPSDEDDDDEAVAAGSPTDRPARQAPEYRRRTWWS
jgi:DNA repair exonuclease SbcCD ATPase subunit